MQLRSCRFWRKRQDSIQDPAVDEVVDDLQNLLKAPAEKAPFILVSHSIAGIYIRTFVTRFPEEVAGLVFLDSSHEEQALRLHEIDTQGSGLDELTAQLGFYVQPGKRLVTEGAISSLGSHLERTSTRYCQVFDAGAFRLAEKSGHFIQLDQPYGHSGRPNISRIR